MADELLQPFSSFGECLRYHRQRARLTQDEFGVAVGYSRAHLARMESNQRLPDVASVRAKFIEALYLQPGSIAATQLIDLATASHLPERPTQPQLQQPTAPRANNLPAALTSFIGRERELAELTTLMPSTRLLTLTGSGGAGKTRLALQLAASVADRYVDGVWLVELAALTDPAFVTQTVSSSLKSRDSSPTASIDTLVAQLKDKSLLIILDNCEHLIDACASISTTLLRQCSGVSILATSREALSIMGELAWRVPSLPLPAEGAPIDLAQLEANETVRLFVERTRLVAPRWMLSHGNAIAVQQICARLDGIPLAIELAAAQMAALSAREIAARLDDRFRLLRVGNRSSLPRHQTLRALIDWSIHLLTPLEKLLLSRLAVFLGGWTLEAAEDVCAGGDIEQADVLGLLLRLVDQSLVFVDTAGSTRYGLLETIRQYVLEVLRAKNVSADEDTALRARHLTYFTALGEATKPEVLAHESAVDQVSLLARLWLDIDNVRAALEWARASGRIDDGLRLGHAWFFVFVIRDIQGELVGWLESLLERVSPYGNSVIQGRAWVDVTNIHVRQAEWDAATLALSRAELIGQLQEDAQLLADMARWASGFAQLRGDFQLARSAHEKWRNLVMTNNLMTAEKLVSGEAFWLGGIALSEHDYVQAEQYYRQYLSSLDPTNKNDVSTTARMLGYALLYQGKWAAAHPWFLKSLEDNHAIGTLIGVTACIAACGAVALASGRPAQAARLYGAVETITRKIGTPLMTSDVQEMQRNLADVRQQLNETAYLGAWAEGQAMSFEQAIEAARAIPAIQG